MITLVRVELTRLLWRRAVVGLLVVAVLTGAAVLAIRFFDTRPQSFDEVASSYGSDVYQEVDRCVEQGRYEGQRAASRSDCERLVADGYGYHPSLDMEEESSEGGGVAVMLLVGLLMLLAGTTFAGNDWNTGSMSNQLLFEPRRLRVWSAKAIAVTLLGGVTTLVVGAAFWTGIWATVAARDLPIRNHALQHGYEQVLWGVAFGAACAFFGYALTMLLRSTVASIGSMMAAMFLAVVTYGVLGLEGDYERLMPWGNFIAYATGRYEYFGAFAACSGFDGSCYNESNTISRGDSLLYFGLLLVVVAVPSVLTFHERDVP